jgi:integrase
MKKLPYLHTVTNRKGGSKHYYVRRKGFPLVPVKGKPGSPEFMESYRAAFTGTDSNVPASAPTQAIKHTWRWLCQRYMESAEFRQLAESTRGQRKSVLEGTWEEPLKPGSRDLMGDCPLSVFGAKHIRVLRDRRADMPDAANHRVKFIGYVYTWALEAEPDLVNSNPARDVGKLKVKPGGYHTWTLAEVQQYEERHPIGTKARLALAIFMFTGVRRSDAVKLGQPSVHAGQIQWTETKDENNNPKERDIPLLPQLKEIIDATPVVGTTTWLVTDFGKPFSVAGFGNKMRQWCNQAGLPHCSAHGLRKAGATIAAENGATAHQLMSIFGWETLKQVEKYTRKARAKRLAREAMHLIVARDEGTSLEQKV